MPDLIKLLPSHVANQIAAGEVIQRPSSVVKELIENAIDAKADNIVVNIKDSGKSLIQVIDNGDGMTLNDALLCFERHATSKVQNAEDLFELTTKGFRGEALASIAAISHVELRTKLESQETGSIIVIEGSQLKKSEETVTPKGSSFEIKNLFFNVPARRNFLKKDTTEFNHIIDEFSRVALAHPEISFSLYHNDKNIYQLLSGVLRKRVTDLLGKSVNDKLVPIEETTEIVKLKGFVLRPESAKKRRGDQYLFVNNRFFKSAYFNHAVSKAFEGLIEHGAYPSYCLYLDVETSKIDVNVHPTKTEIKFQEEKHIYSIILSSIRQALGKYNISPTLDFERETVFDLPLSSKGKSITEPEIKVDENYNPFKTTSKNKGNRGSGGASNFSKAIVQQGFGSDEAAESDWKNFYKVNEEEESIQLDIKTESELDEQDQKKPTYIVKNHFIIMPSRSGFMLIHGKRAMEQILYNRMHKSFVSNPIESQKLLFPLEIEISKKEISKWREHASILKQLGFEGETNEIHLSVTSVPAILQEESISKALEGIINALANGEIEKDDIAHELISSVASIGSSVGPSLKADEEVETLIDHLFQCENHMYTPRNKKIIETITIENLNEILG